MSPYLRLMRLHQPTGIWLLLWPCWWSIALASYGIPPLFILMLFGIGAVFMRGAGCIINDIADRKLDAQVERTRNRPLASGEITVKQACALLFILLALSLGIAVLLGTAVMLWAALSLIPVAIYPWTKRISWWPQLFLGLTFNWGALMGWVAMRGTLAWPPVILYIGCIFWTLGYDTIYAHQDKKDDARIGIKSTALKFSEHPKKILMLFYTLASLCWLEAVMLRGVGVLAYGFLLAAYGHFSWQVARADLNSPPMCKKMFESNILLGWVVMIGIVIGRST